MAHVQVHIQAYDTNAWIDVTSRTRFPVNLIEGRAIAELGGAIPAVTPGIMSFGLYDDERFFSRTNPDLAVIGSRVRIQWGQTAAALTTRYIGRLAVVGPGDNDILQCEAYGPLAKVTGNQYGEDRLYINDGAHEVWRKFLLQAQVDPADIESDQNLVRRSARIRAGINGLRDIERNYAGVAIEKPDGKLRLELQATQNARAVSRHLTDLVPLQGEAGIPRPRKLTQTHPIINAIEVILEAIGPSSDAHASEDYLTGAVVLQFTPGITHSFSLSLDSGGLIGSESGTMFELRLFWGGQHHIVTTDRTSWRARQGNAMLEFDMSGISLTHDQRYMTLEFGYTGALVVGGNRLASELVMLGSLRINNTHSFQFGTKEFVFRANDSRSQRQFGPRPRQEPLRISVLVDGTVDEEFLFPQNIYDAAQSFANGELERSKTPRTVYQVDEGDETRILARRMWDKEILRLDEGTRGEYFVEALETAIWDVIPMQQNVYFVRHRDLTDPDAPTIPPGPPVVIPDPPVGNHRPIVEVIIADDIIAPGESTAVRCNATDRDPGHQAALTYSWRWAPNIGQIVGSGFAVIYQAPGGGDAMDPDYEAPPAVDTPVVIFCDVRDPDGALSQGSDRLVVDVPEGAIWDEFTRHPGAFAVQFTSENTGLPNLLVRTTGLPPITTLNVNNRWILFSIGGLISAPYGTIGPRERIFPLDMYESLEIPAIEMIRYESYFTGQVNPRITRTLKLLYIGSLTTGGKQSWSTWLAGIADRTIWRAYVVDVESREYAKFSIRTASGVNHWQGVTRGDDSPPSAVDSELQLEFDSSAFRFDPGKSIDTFMFNLNVRNVIVALVPSTTIVPAETPAPPPPPVEESYTIQMTIGANSFNDLFGYARNNFGSLNPATFVRTQHDDMPTYELILLSGSGTIANPTSIQMGPRDRLPNVLTITKDGVDSIYVIPIAFRRAVQGSVVLQRSTGPAVLARANVGDTVDVKFDYGLTTLPAARDETHTLQMVIGGGVKGSGNVVNTYGYEGRGTPDATELSRRPFGTLTPNQFTRPRDVGQPTYTVESIYCGIDAVLRVWLGARDLHPNEIRITVEGRTSRWVYTDSTRGLAHVGTIGTPFTSGAGNVLRAVNNGKMATVVFDYSTPDLGGGDDE